MMEQSNKVHYYYKKKRRDEIIMQDISPPQIGQPHLSFLGITILEQLASGIQVGQKH